MKNGTVSVAFIVVMLLGVSVVAAQGLSPQAAIRYAAPIAQGSGDCSSWGNACTLQTALTGAVSGDEIWVKAGVHYPGTAGNRDATFELKSGVAIYGGFAGTETARNQRNPRVNQTILSGDIDQNDTNTDGNFIAEMPSAIQGSNAYHVVSGSLTDSTAVLDGFVITAGQANGSAYDSLGGGMINDSGSPTLTNLTFSGNSADYGGGMYNFGENGNSSPTLTNVIFSGNTATYYGGGMYNDSDYSSPTLTNVTFSGNSAYIGGGMYNDGEYSSPTLTNCILWGNTADYGSQMYSSLTSPSVSYSDIQGGYAGTGNINADPLFVNAAGGNLRLQAGSPAIDAGDNAAVPGGITTDLDGLPRFADGNGDTFATVDMGAYEAGAMICSVTAGNTYTFNDQSGVSLEITTQGNLACLYVDEMETNHPNATTGIQTGRYWLIRGLKSDKQTDATGFSVNLTLPTNFTPDENDKVCRYTGSGQVWDCAADSHMANSITRSGVTAFSDWAVGNNVGPTAVTLRRLTAFSASNGWTLLISLGVLIGVGLWMTKGLRRIEK